VEERLRLLPHHHGAALVLNRTNTGRYSDAWRQFVFWN